MKPQKKETQQRNAEREVKEEIKWEYDNVLGDDILDEIALVDCLIEEDE